MTTPVSPLIPADITPPPEKIGPYHILREIGSGGMGTVYLGEHEETELQAAVKVLPASLAREPGLVARFMREIDATRKIQNPHVVRLYESGADGETYFYAMEYVDGETLTARLQREKRLDWKTTIDLGLQICRALKAAHNVGVIHRDLKPSNLLISREGTVKLSDFGVAQVFASGKLTVTGGVIGTAEYMSPEQAQGKRATKQSDIYSLGAVMYVMLTGRPPFTGKTALDIAQKHRFGQFDSPRRVVPEIPHWLDEIVCKCLEKRPEDRYPDAYVLSLRLAEVPRKVELSQSPVVLDAGDASPTAETAAGTGTPERPQLEGAGTLMRDLVRAEFERTAVQTPLQRVLDNTWFLVTAFVLLIIAGIWWIRSRNPDPEALFARGAALMQQDPGPAWEAASRDYFAPLLKLDAAQWEPRIDPYRDQLSLFELIRSMGRSGGLRDTPVPRNDIERFVHRALVLRQLGDWNGAREILLGLLELLPEDASYAPRRRLVRDLLATLPETDSTQESELLRSAVDKARALAWLDQHAEAQDVWRGILLLYDESELSPELLEEARRALETAPAHDHTEPPG